MRVSAPVLHLVLAPSAPVLLDACEPAAGPRPLRTTLTIAQRGPGEVVLSMGAPAAGTYGPTLVHWEVASDPNFRTIERYGVFVAQPAPDDALTITLRALEPGRPYWARVRAGGSWSETAHVRTYSHQRRNALRPLAPAPLRHASWSLASAH